MNFSRRRARFAGHWRKSSGAAGTAPFGPARIYIPPVCNSNFALGGRGRRPKGHPPGQRVGAGGAAGAVARAAYHADVL